MTATDAPTLFENADEATTFIGHREFLALAYALIDEHAPEGWSFRWDNAVRRLGCCHYSNKTLSFSRALTERISLRESRETILHEIGHAIAGHAAAHGAEWKRAVLAIGGNPTRCYSASTGEVAVVRGAYTGTCPSCGETVQRHRRPTKRFACTPCCRTLGGNRFDARFEFVWTVNR